MFIIAVVCPVAAKPGAVIISPEYYGGNIPCLFLITAQGCSVRVKGTNNLNYKVFGKLVGWIGICCSLNFRIILLISALNLFLRLEKVQTVQMHLECQNPAHRVPAPSVRLSVLCWALSDLGMSTAKEPGGVHGMRALFIWKLFITERKDLCPLQKVKAKGGVSTLWSPWCCCINFCFEWPSLYLFGINVTQPSLVFLFDLHLSSFSSTMNFC